MGRLDISYQCCVSPSSGDSTYCRSASLSHVSIASREVPDGAKLHKTLACHIDSESALLYAGMIWEAVAVLQ